MSESVDELLERLRRNPPKPLSFPARITQKEIDSLTSARDDDGWNDAIDAIKATRGEYPSDWGTNVFTRGMCALRGATWTDQ